jgi:mono/diheme cytochrome c family protein
MFRKSCSGCHGSDGDSGDAPDLTSLFMARNEVILVITYGRGSMHGFADVYNENEINAIADYVISIRK